MYRPAISNSNKIHITEAQLNDPFFHASILRCIICRRQYFPMMLDIVFYIIPSYMWILDNIMVHD